jgi:hypothetical protein
MKKAPTGSRSRKKIAPSTESSSEEVVGQLDIAIGSSKSQKGDTNKNSILDSLDFEEQDGDLPLPTPSSHGAPTLDGFMYESDSSQESVPSKRKTPQKDIMAPLNLPLQAESLPVGIGEAERPFPYEIPDSITSGGVKSMTEVIAQSVYSETGVSPFVGVRRSEDLEWERDSWFLVQLPTRLPPLKAKTEDTPNAMDIHDNKRDNVTSPDVQLSSISEVVTQPVSEISFDNVLKSAAAGRIGKIVVYKSGKTVLMMKGPNDEKEVRMIYLKLLVQNHFDNLADDCPIFLLACCQVRFNVTEGLTCGFLQQAVSTDSEHGKYTELGEVKKSIVVSPILDSEFSN